MFKGRYIFILVTIGLICLVPSVWGQDLLWSGNYGGQYNDLGQACQQTADLGFVALGSTYSFGDGDFDIYLIKFDSLGDTLFSRTYGGTATDRGFDIVALSDGGFIIAGHTRSSGAGGLDVYLVRVSAEGALVWSRTYGGAADDEARSICAVSDGNFVVCGTTSSFGAGYSDIYLLKINASGDTLWTKTYGGVGGDLGSDVNEVSSGGFIITGTTGSFGEGYSNMYAVRTDSAGDTLWTAFYGGNRADLGYCGKESLDGGFIFSGATASLASENYYDAYLVKTDDIGFVDWEMNYGGSYEDRAYSVSLTSDGGYLLAGTTESYGAGNIDIYVVKVDPLGEQLWYETYGGNKSDYCYNIVQASQYNYYLVGSSYTYTSGGTDLYLLKVAGDNPTPVEDEPDALYPTAFSLHQNYPNPFNSGTQIEFTLAVRTSVTLGIYNVLGQQVREWDMGELPVGTYQKYWDGCNGEGSTVASGIYFYRLRSENFQETRKMILLK